MNLSALRRRLHYVDIQTRIRWARTATGAGPDTSTGPAPDGYNQPLLRARHTASNRLRAPVLRRITER